MTSDQQLPRVPAYQPSTIPMSDQGIARPVARPKALEDVHIDDLLNLVVEKNASDLHLAVKAPPVLRIDGVITPLPYERFTPDILQGIVYDILSDPQIEHFERQLELDLSYELPGDKGRFRVNVFRDRGNVAAAFRLIPAQIPTVRELELPLLLEELSRKPRGLILCTGPTGHGKSTTLAAMIHQMNLERSLHIITVEDPIEFLHTHRKSLINQRELGRDTLKFSEALRSALREDPDVIQVGEMRDLETMELAITAAETGHLVLSTLHTNTAAETVDRVVDVFPTGQQQQIRLQLSNNLVAVLSQQLLPKAHQPGRLAAMEILIATPAVRNLIRESKAHQIPSVIQTNAEEGMISMDQCLATMCKRGLVTVDAALERAVDPEEFRKLLQGPAPQKPGRTR